MATQSPLALAIYNVRDYGATGQKADNAQSAIQQAIDACAAAGGGMVYVPPGEYTTGTLHLRTHVRFYVEAGATLYASKDPAHFDKRAFFYAEDVHHISLEGQGVIDGQAEYFWKAMEHRDWYIYPNQLLAEQNGVSLERAFPTDNSIGNLVHFVRCQDVDIFNLSFLHSPSWTMHLWGCERLVIDGVYVYTTQRSGVWADGIDPDGCKDLRISNCTIETGDDALVFYSTDIYGPARPCENITVTNCRLSSSSSGLKFCDGIMNACRNVTIDNCVVTGSNRGIAFMMFAGGIIENVIISNCTVECKRFDWFWWGDGDPIHFNLIQYSDIDPTRDAAKEKAPGIIRNVILSNIIARGPGPNKIHGHKDSWLENITFDNVRLTVTADPESPWRKGQHALAIDNVRNFKLKDVEITWEAPALDHWQSAISLENGADVTLDGVSARQGLDAPNAPAVVLTNINNAVVRDCTAQPGTAAFLHIADAATQDVVVVNNDFRQAKTAFTAAPGASPVKESW
jgi:polygalacturonase